jgi:hypothetical protein
VVKKATKPFMIIFFQYNQPPFIVSFQI